ncbi:DUF2760 domain-containing protein [Vibrio sp. V27_P1S3P104]|uniref:DUF2760 domain-containing protein n=1 Tax=unclassified Vibrio TaxID=2614977 RepID=UPI001372CD72|nr:MULTISPECIES: DUF2760 domain-containing protein [unclassified Vibrio]NAW69333.1 DUF2760 domain-containing protein [Vibrio sp. V28_P6S34P95]NAX05156.1 DUF2760 domain-containing protein [Vibrio sp. V30_P3S12P165]NAX33287.1 DUF2760 domain-containing protein [Vibrio sp. V29_P1S30P107]NAX36544.1 DUF2760 domain-containing protein [Vibrio sp. V27_P1S3P104]NNN43671.1 DUF2760 domain-containing protein [Vibrio sp. 1-1(7)]
MNFDLTMIPSTFDMFHAGLAASTLFLLLFSLSRKSKIVEKVIEKPIEKIVEIEKPVEKIIEVEKIVEVEKVIEKVVEVQSKLATAATDSAMQLLSIMQQEARLIDFLQEDLTHFSDEEVGAAARVIHSGGQKVLNEYLTLEPICSEAEETRVTIEEGFNPQSIRLIGNVTGHAPFTGTLIHKGWKATAMHLPQLAQHHDVSIITPAEVEL